MRYLDAPDNAYLRHHPMKVLPRPSSRLCLESYEYQQQTHKSLPYVQGEQRVSARSQEAIPSERNNASKTPHTRPFQALIESEVRGVVIAIAPAAEWIALTFGLDDKTTDISSVLVDKSNDCCHSPNLSASDGFTLNNEKKNKGGGNRH